MTAQPSTAIQPYRQLKTLLTNDEVKARFTEILDKKAPAFIASILNTVYLDDNLKECDPNSIIMSAMIAATLDLPIDKNIGMAWIIPYKDHGKPIARFQMGYRGYIQLALRTGQYVDLNAAKIYRGETVKRDRLTGRVALSGEPTSDEVIGYNLYFKLVNGFEKYYYMSVEEMRAHAQRYSQGYRGGSDKNPWKTNFDEMGLKTVIANGLRKYGLLSIQMQNVMRQDEPGLIPADDMPTAAQQVIDAEPKDAPFNPVQFLVDNLISENAHAAAGLLKKAPEEIRDNPDALLKWGKLYRGWRDLGANSDAAAEHANNGETPVKEGQLL